VAHWKREQPELLSNRRGYTLIEMLVTVAIISILASMAMPYAKMTTVRNQELELKRSLREIRTALDTFHKDWKEGRLNKLEAGASPDGYPKQLTQLVEGVRLSGKLEQRKKYLRRIPKDPFSDASLAAEQQWHYIGYRDSADAEQWNGIDIYDIRSQSERQALDKSSYRDW